MKIRHNKKRNTAFIYESLVREVTVASMKKDKARHKRALSLLKKHFREGTILKQHLDCYRSLYQNQDLDKRTAERILIEAKQASRLLDAHGLFVKQSDLIKDVNVEMERDFYNTFVPNYRTLATIYHIFSEKSSPKHRVMLETQLLSDMSNTPVEASPLGDVDDIVYRSFVAKFNDKYNNSLLGEQKLLLEHYIASFVNNGLELKIYLNSELVRLRQALEESLERDVIKEDPQMLAKTKNIIERFSSFKEEPINDKMLLTVLKTQQLVKEIFEDADRS